MILGKSVSAKSARMNSNTKRILEDTSINEDLLHKHRSLILHYYKNSKTLRKQVRIIHPSSDTLELRRSSNLTFRGFLANTTLVLSVRYFLCCAGVVVSVQGLCGPLVIFQYYQLAPSMGKTTTCKPYRCLPDKELHGTYLLDGDHQQCSRR